ncbi:DUF2786 domain-containing protein [Aestuariimicrobium kwangyangense]|uniref:DUF2786 domain-containing protein n=1 Tax=Aestuariimicrobium kwangyangense TaxID=396389 RepID=UPI000688D450|nr:DUF2786 domain-containing protein [Aestuariimicrobium kwangyangense]
MESVITRIGKLLAKAESTDSVDEAEALFAKAQALASRYSVELAVARRSQAKTEARETPEERTIDLGRPGQHHLKQIAALFLVVATANDVRCLIATNSSVMYPMGFPSDLDVTEAIHVALSEQMVRFGNAWLRAGDWRHEHYDAGVDRWGRVVRKPMTARVARRSFYEGFITEIRRRFTEARDEAVAESERRHAAESAVADGKRVSVTSLALREKTEEVNEFHRQRVRSLRVRSSWRGSATMATRGPSSEAGRRAGARASMSSARQVSGG